MNYRILSAVALAATVCLASPALACKGNNVLFEDNFADDSNWGNIADGSSMADEIFTLKADKGLTYHYFYMGDTFDTADICLDVAQLTEDDSGAGILFAAEGAESYYYFWVNPLGGAGVSRYAKKRWVTPVPFRRVKLEGKKATLRLTLRGSKATAYERQQTCGFQGDSGRRGRLHRNRRGRREQWYYVGFQQFEGHRCAVARTEAEHALFGHCPICPAPNLLA